MLLLLVVVVVDVDECALGGEAASCNTTGGVCEGHLPNRKFLCTCQPGYEPVDEKTCKSL